MPRLTNQQYLDARHRLQELRAQTPEGFALLTAEQKWQPHDYFQLCKKLTDAQLLEHREKISMIRPSLPQQAGRALARLIDRTPRLAALRTLALQPALPRTHPDRRRHGEEGAASKKSDGHNGLFQDAADLERHRRHIVVHRNRTDCRIISSSNVAPPTP